MRKMKVGIDIGGSHIAIGVIDENGKILEKREKRLMSADKQDVIGAIVEYVITQTNQLKDKYEIQEVGIAMPGWTKDGIIISSGNLGVKDYNLQEGLQDLNLPVKIQNDAKCAALAEKKYGCLKGYENCLFLTLGTGIGGAAFWNGELLTAKRKLGFEFGHMVIEKEGIPCYCGRDGCFERYASMKALKNDLRKVLQLDEMTRGEELLEIVRRNSPKEKNYEEIERVLEDYIKNLSIGLLNLIRIFEPEAIGIGGSFVYFEEVLLPRLKKYLEVRQDVKIEMAVLGNDAGMIGAVLSK